MSRVIFILRGLPGVGKTTTVQEITNLFLKLRIKFCVLSRDLIREELREERGMLSWSFSPEDEDFVSARFRQMLFHSLRCDKTDVIIIDNTTLSSGRISEIASIVEGYINELKESEESMVFYIDSTVKVFVFEIGDESSSIRKDKDISAEVEKRMREDMAEGSIAARILPHQFRGRFFHKDSWKDTISSPLWCVSSMKRENDHGYPHIFPVEAIVSFALTQNFDTLTNISHALPSKK